MEPDDLVEIELSTDERRLLWWGLGEWSGPANCSENLAIAMDFESVADLLEQERRLRLALEAREVLSARDWRRALLATEFVFASDVFGSGVEWSITTGLRDEETVRTLRRLQRKFARALPGVLYGGR
ncbi:hypothetical protein [Nocardia rosealba]|uniref:hypothetical protein n=1 Tax=Nocardia rosealba TaxID=2878563 RepID=UPI001CDA0542|nr:hypothetical protein [Nocardia rosealba]MCA2207381.1 hypothetical protein [Nocardia rosealba]